MRAEDEVIRAHDVFAQILRGELPIATLEMPEEKLMVTACHDVLCWVLGGHEGNEWFNQLLAEIRQGLEDAGYVLLRPKGESDGKEWTDS